MKIIDIINGKKPSLSFEVFPPKTSDKYDSVSSAIKEIARLNPSYMSVTYGAGGGTSEYTARIAQEVSSLGITSLAHLTCISSSCELVREQLSNLQALGIENILALRGDIPEGLNINNCDFHYSYELIDEIKKHGEFCIGGACYPECHPESESIEKDIEHLKIKVAHGCEFLTTQMFFDNNAFYQFVNRLEKAGINVPVVAGIMPITSPTQFERIVKLSGNALPKSFLNEVLRFENDPEAFRKAGIEFASKQAINLYENGFGAVHIYSMNKPEVARKIQNNLLDVIK
ncbi:MAG: methylenetetrahydrofolate reductase [Clostridia bacterium]|nr:methylenetetrahydrofolate reductase [NAD(P)H] [Clostridia bacterium]